MDILRFRSIQSLITFSIAFFSAGPMAAPNSVQQLKNMTFEQRLAPMGEIKTPTRMAKVQFIVTKISKQKQSDGSFKTVTEQVCSREEKVGVYDIPKGDTGRPDTSQPFQCKTGLAIGPSTISLIGFIQIYRDLESPFPAGEIKDWKMFFSSFSVTADDGSFVKAGFYDVSISEDAKQKTIIQALNSSNLTNDMDPNTKLEDLVMVLVRFED